MKRQSKYNLSHIARQSLKRTRAYLIQFTHARVYTLIALFASLLKSHRERFNTFKSVFSLLQIHFIYVVNLPYVCVRVYSSRPMCSAVRNLKRPQSSYLFCLNSFNNTSKHIDLNAK